MINIIIYLNNVITLSLISACMRILIVSFFKAFLAHELLDYFPPSYKLSFYYAVKKRDLDC